MVSFSIIGISDLAVSTCTFVYRAEGWKIACVIICPQGDGILAASKDRKSEKKG